MKPKRIFPVVITARLKLRKPLLKDARALRQVSEDEAVMRYYGMGAFRTNAEALDEIAWFNWLFDHAAGIRWVLALKGQSGYIGDIGLHNYAPAHSRAEIGFKLARPYWHRGLMTEALEAALDYGWRVMRLNRIEAVVDPRNAPCLGLLKKAGFREEGLLREYEHETAGFVDLTMLSLLRGDRPLSP